MKRIVYLTCIGSLALALTAWGAQKNKGGYGSARGGGARSAHVVSPRSGGGHSIARANEFFECVFLYPKHYVYRHSMLSSSQLPGKLC
jgi:hypothetical protein